MDPVSAILSAVVAGATAVLNETGSQAIKDAYAGIKRILKDTYEFASTSLFDQTPDNEAFKSAVESELKASKAAEDVAVLEEANRLLDAVEDVPEAELLAWGIDVKVIKAGRDALFKGISGTAGGLRAERIEAGQDVRFEDVRGGSTGEAPDAKK